MSKNNLRYPSYTLCWPSIPNSLVQTTSYDHSTLSKIPMGSLYFSIRRDLPLFKRCSYNMIGIICQNKEKTYVYTIYRENIVMIDLEELIINENIIYHGIYPLKNFECSDDKLRRIRDELFLDFFEIYRIRAEYSHTPELIGHILFQIGLIWDDRYDTNGSNPAYYIDKDLFMKLDNPRSNKDDVIIRIKTPENLCKCDPHIQKEIDEELEDQIERNIQQYIFEYTCIEPLYIKLNAITIFFEGLDISDFFESTCLNMDWYHKSLITIESHGYQKDPQAEIDSSSAKNPQYFNSNLLFEICNKINDFAGELHSIVCECDTHVYYNGKDHLAQNYTSNDYECKIRLHLDHNDHEHDYIMVLPRYMWRCDWQYRWMNPPKIKSDHIYHLIQDFRDLLIKTPINCILRELIVHLYRQAKEVKKYYQTEIL